MLEYKEAPLEDRNIIARAMLRACGTVLAIRSHSQKQHLGKQIFEHGRA